MLQLDLFGNIYTTVWERIATKFGLSTVTADAIRGKLIIDARRHKERDKLRGITDTLNHDAFADIIDKAGTSCHMCGYPMEWNIEKLPHIRDWQLTFDALHAEKGHVAQNVVCMHHNCNAHKNIDLLDDACRKRNMRDYVDKAHLCITTHHPRLGDKLQKWAEERNISFEWACYMVMHPFYKDVSFLIDPVVAFEEENQMRGRRRYLDRYLDHVTEHFDKYNDVRQVAHEYFTQIQLDKATFKAEQFQLYEQRRLAKAQEERLAKEQKEQYRERLSHIRKRFSKNTRCWAIKSNGRKCKNAPHYIVNGKAACFCHVEDELGNLRLNV